MPPKRRGTRAGSKKAKEKNEELEKQSEEPEHEEDQQELNDDEEQEIKPKRTRTRSKRKQEADESVIQEEESKSFKKDSTSKASLSSTLLKKKELTSSTPISKKRPNTDPTPDSSDKHQRIGRKLEAPKQSPSRLLSPVRKISAVSKIPSPVKRNSLVSKVDELRKTEIAVNQAFLNKNVAKLDSIIDELRASKAEQILVDYKNSVETRLKTSDDLIASLTAQNHQLLQEIAQLKVGQIVSPTKARQEDDLFENELILDMMEQIVGLRIHKAEDQDYAIFFDCSQSGKNGILDYRLTISKEDSSEILYTPIDTNNDQEALKPFLPEYFFDNLTFPLETLQQFYHKIYRGLNK